LLHKVKQLKNTPIRFIKSRDAIAYTQVSSSFMEFVSQRIRWASKGKNYFDADSIVFMSITVAMNLLLLLFLIGCFFSLKVLALFFMVLSFKSICDYLLFQNILPFFKKKRLLLYVFPMELFITMYVSFIGIATVFYTPKWKGRTIN